MKAPIWPNLAYGWVRLAAAPTCLSSVDTTKPHPPDYARPEDARPGAPSGADLGRAPGGARAACWGVAPLRAARRPPARRGAPAPPGSGSGRARPGLPGRPSRLHGRDPRAEIGRAHG